MPWHWLFKENKKTLQAKIKIPSATHKQRDSTRVSPCTSASLTVEAAFVLPLFFIGMVMLISFMDLFRIQAQVTLALNESAKELGMYAYAVGDYEEQTPVGVLTDAVCIRYTKGKLAPEKNVTVSLRNSHYRNHQVKLQADITYRFPAALFPLPPLRIVKQVSVHDWLGYDGAETGQGDNTQMVYVTERQTVYHTFSDCTHLDLSILQVAAADISKRRNDSGGKYYPCTHCVRSAGHNHSFYITSSGDRYHSDAGCSSLKRTVRFVPLTEVSGLHECSRCQQRRK